MQALEELDRGQKATDYLETMVRYIINARDDTSFLDMHDVVKNVLPKGGELLMTIAETLRNEGIEIGVKKGKEIGVKKGKEIGVKKGVDMTLTALEAFREGQALEEVMKLTGLERDKLLKIQKQAFK